MNNRAALYVQAIRGPVLLITIGILFAAHQAGMLPVYKTWPLILIMIGLMKLIERMFAPSPPVPPAGPIQAGPFQGGPAR